MLQDKNAVACTQVYMYTVCLHLEQAFETLLEEMNLDTDVLEKHSLYCSSFEPTVACMKTCMIMPCCVTAVGLCKIIEKSYQWWVHLLFSVLRGSVLHSILDSLFSILHLCKK